MITVVFAKPTWIDDFETTMDEIGEGAKKLGEDVLQTIQDKVFILSTTSDPAKDGDVKFFCTNK